jgi:hypothetical protein
MGNLLDSVDNVGGRIYTRALAMVLASAAVVVLISGTFIIRSGGTVFGCRACCCGRRSTLATRARSCTDARAAVLLIRRSAPSAADCVRTLTSVAGGSCARQPLRDLKGARRVQQPDPLPLANDLLVGAIDD